MALQLKSFLSDHRSIDLRARRPPKHVHSREEEGFFVIGGEVEFRAGDIDTALNKGDSIALLKGIPHSWIEPIQAIP